jgi:hypothetical protein
MRVRYDRIRGQLVVDCAFDIDRPQLEELVGELTTAGVAHRHRGRSIEIPTVRDTPVESVDRLGLERVI